MHRITKFKNSKCGFTLTEMVIIIGIIVILASAVGAGIADTLKNAKKSKAAVEDSCAQLKQRIDDSESILRKYNFGS